MGKNKLTDFDMGVLYAAGLIASPCGHPTEAAWLLNEAGLEDADVSSMDVFDKRNLKALKGEKYIKLKGLRIKKRPKE